MKSEKETLEQLGTVSEVKMSPQRQQEIWNHIEEALGQEKPKRAKRHSGVWGTSAAAVAAVLLVAGGFYAYSGHGQRKPPSNTTASRTTVPNNSVTYASEMAVIHSKGYSVTAHKPNASVKTATGETLSAWICILSASQDGYAEHVFFFLNGKFLETDAQLSPEITTAKAAGTGAIAVTYPVYKSTDALAKPTGTPVTITYTWNGSKLVANKPYPKQFG
ncbi:LppP/LprE family lipoprotein [Alicyclobacillus sp. ALC3]|uniref:LppP/LprE family lipoprotein n=1 Tax=Alicyclobacillus sp. ALC3 TaxID=2796143 RepID=UPI0023782D11|nr:LppP/LprE family lipoprotein [Alicyclobacillus sp. ALC3]WDL95921.1 LppP/LprE family lipoprotein [Alicyclobacillus sp. ALC3]